MAKNNTYKDVNREAYLKALFTDLLKQSHLTALPERAQIMYDFIMTNPTNSTDKMDKNGMVIRNNCVLIKSRKARART